MKNLGETGQDGPCKSSFKTEQFWKTEILYITKFNTAYKSKFELIHDKCLHLPRVQL